MFLIGHRVVKFSPIGINTILKIFMHRVSILWNVNKLSYKLQFLIKTIILIFSNYKWLYFVDWYDMEHIKTQYSATGMFIHTTLIQTSKGYKLQKLF